MKISNKALQTWVESVAAQTKAEKVVWIDGSSEQLSALKAEAVSTGELIKLNEELLPDCYLHRSAQNDVARVEGRTYICTKEKENAGPLNNWMEEGEAKKLANSILDGAMAGRTMYVIPYVMGPIESPYSKIGIELTDSIYVVINMNIMSFVGEKVIAKLGENGKFVKGIHAKAEVNPDKRYIMHFPDENTIISMNSAYGGNALLGKKCHALRIASAQGKREGWMAEHMLILGIENPQGDVKYVAAAFPSACGKTNLAMLIPPEEHIKKGYKVWCVGDDIAWIHIGDDGRFWAVNPENGFFGVAPGTSNKTNPNAMKSAEKGTIFTNVAYNPKNNTVWWEGHTDPAPEHLIDWKGEEWTPSMGTKAAHPNSRFTAPKQNCPCLSPEAEAPEGVPLSAIVFGGRRAKTMPLVFEAKNFEHGVFVGASMASETTAAAAGAVGVVRHDPMAMLPFCGYNIGDYFEHWIDMGKKAKNPPKIFNVNWFKTNADGKFMWPGFGENLRVLLWMLDRCEGKVDANEIEIGYVPRAEDLEIAELGLDTATIKELMGIDKEVWKDEVKGTKEFFDTIDHLPKALNDMLSELSKKINA